MRTIKYTFRQDGEFFLGFLNEYPDYWTQGDSKEDLLENSEEPFGLVKIVQIQAPRDG